MSSTISAPRRVVARAPVRRSLPPAAPACRCSLARSPWVLRSPCSTSSVSTSPARLSDLWDQITSVPARYIIPALVLQTGQTVFAGLSYYGILRAAYGEEVRFAPIVTAYAVVYPWMNAWGAQIRSRCKSYDSSHDRVCAPHARRVALALEPGHLPDKRVMSEGAAEASFSQGRATSAEGDG